MYWELAVESDPLEPVETAADQALVETPREEMGVMETLVPVAAQGEAAAAAAAREETAPMEATAPAAAFF